MSHAAAVPVRSVPYFTPGTLLLSAIALAGLGLGLWRFIAGLEATTNLDDQFPWGLWIAVDVASGVALAAGGFTSAGLAHVLHRDKYHPVVRAALLTAMLGYTFVALGLLFDLGRYYNVWHPLIMWQGNSVLFEVGMCVIAYLTVLYLEFVPVVAERLRSSDPLPALLQAVRKPLGFVVGLADRFVGRIMGLLIILGIVLSSMHQSSLGSLMLIAPSKVHPLWFTPVLPVFFLMSAVCVGFPMVMFESLLASRSFRREPEMDVLTPLARFVPVLLALYLAMKGADMAIRESWRYLLPLDLPAAMFLTEVGGGIVLPLVLLLSDRVKRSPAALFVASALVVGGVVLNRINVFLVAYTPPYATQSYFPSIAEFGVTAGLICLLVLVYRFLVMNLPVIPAAAAKEVTR